MHRLYQHVPMHQTVLCNVRLNSSVLDPLKVNVRLVLNLHSVSVLHRADIITVGKFSE